VLGGSETLPECVKGAHRQDGRISMKYEAHNTMHVMLHPQSRSGITASVVARIGQQLSSATKSSTFSSP
jgi:hypothetical protein